MKYQLALTALLIPALLLASCEKKRAPQAQPPAQESAIQQKLVAAGFNENTSVTVVGEIDATYLIVHTNYSFQAASTAHASNKLVVFENGNIAGFYYGIDLLPKIEENALIFPCEAAYGNTADFSDGIPQTIWVDGETHTFATETAQPQPFEKILFELNKDVTAKNGNIDSPEYELAKGTVISFDFDYHYYLNFDDDSYFFTVQGKYNGEKLKFNGDDLSFTEYKNYSILDLESFWCMSYYYEALKNNDLSIIKRNNEFMESDRGTGLLFQPLFFKLGNSYIGAQSSIRGDYGAISRILEHENGRIIFEVLTRDCGINELEEKWRWEPAYKKLYEEKCPYKLLFLFDGDFAKVYINAISDDTYLFELARADKNTLKQITNFVKNGSLDSSGIKYPEYASADTRRGMAQ